MKNIGHRQAVAGAELLNRRQHPRQGTAGHDAVLEVVAGEAPAQGGDRRLAALPKQRPLLRIGGLAHGAGPRLGAELGGELHRRDHLPLLPVQLDQQERRRIAGIFINAEVVVHRLDREAIHHFHASREHPGGSHLTHRLAGRFHAGEVS